MSPLKRFGSISEALDLFEKAVAGEAASAGMLSDKDRMRYQKDPISFVREVLGLDPYDKQEMLMLSVANNDRTTVRSCHGIGKTWSAASIILWFLSCFVPSTVVTTAPTGRQVKDILWKEINSQYHQAKIPLGGRILTQQLIMSDTSKWFATGFSTDDYNVDAFQGFHNTNILVVVDEACGVASNIFAAIEGLLSSGVIVRLLMIGNPSAENTDFGTSFKSDLYAKFHLSAFDSPNFTMFGIVLDDIRSGSWKSKLTGELPRPYLTDPKWVAQRYSAWGESSPLWQVRVMGNFPTEDDFALVPLYWIERAQNLRLESVGSKILGVDVARTGSDESVAILRHGGVISVSRTWSKKDTMQSAGMVASIINESDPDIANIDVIGVGAGVVDRLAEQGFKVKGINVGERSNESDKYFNLRSELYWKLRMMLERNELQLPDDSVLVSDLMASRWEYTSKGQLKLESKDEIKKRLGKSPDRADALALTMDIGMDRIVVDDISDVLGIIEKGGMESSVYLFDGSRYNKSENAVCPKCGLAQGLIFDDCGVPVRCFICDNPLEVALMEDR